MQQVICYYLSGFGFGHLTRSLAVMENILATRNDIHILIKATPRLLAKAEQYLGKFEGRFSLHPFYSGFAIVTNPATFCIDLQATQEDVLKWLAGLPASAEHEGQFLQTGNVSLVLSDIVPEAFAAAKIANIPAIGISNFTWYEVCADFIQDKHVLTTLLEMYKQAACLLVYPYSTGDLVPIAERIQIGLVVRPFDPVRIEQIRKQYKQAGCPLAFLSVGGSTRIEEFPIREDMDYLITMGIKVPELPNVYSLPPDMTDSHNYLAACDVTITKCGWSTVAEATRAEKPMWLMLSKNGWLEELCIFSEIAALGIGRARAFEDMRSLSTEEVSTELGEMRDAYCQLPSGYYDGLDKLTNVIEAYLGQGLGTGELGARG